MQQVEAGLVPTKHGNALEAPESHPESEWFAICRGAHAALDALRTDATHAADAAHGVLTS